MNLEFARIWPKSHASDTFYRLKKGGPKLHMFRFYLPYGSFVARLRQAAKHPPKQRDL